MKKLTDDFFLLKMRIIFAFMYNSLLHFITKLLEKYKYLHVLGTLLETGYIIFLNMVCGFLLFGGMGGGVLIYA